MISQSHRVTREHKKFTVCLLQAGMGIVSHVSKWVCICTHAAGSDVQVPLRTGQLCFRQQRSSTSGRAGANGGTCTLPRSFLGTIPLAATGGAHAHVCHRPNSRVSMPMGCAGASSSPSCMPTKIAHTCFASSHDSSMTDIRYSSLSSCCNDTVK